jgi:hypothetical protein
MNDGLRQLLPRQLQPLAVTATASIITYDTIRDIVGFSSPRQSASLVDDTSSMTAARNRNPPRSSRRHSCCLFFHVLQHLGAAARIVAKIASAVCLRAMKMPSHFA